MNTHISKKSLLFLSIALLAMPILAKHTHQKKEAKSEKKSHVTIIKDQKHFEQALGSHKPVVIKFYAEWCGACKSMDKGFHAVAERYHDDVDFIAVNVDNKALADTVAHYDVKALPTVIYRQMGALPEHELEARVKAFAPKRIDVEKEVTKESKKHKKHTKKTA